MCFLWACVLYFENINETSCVLFCFLTPNWLFVFLFLPNAFRVICCQLPIIINISIIINLGCKAPIINTEISACFGEKLLLQADVISIGQSCGSARWKQAEWRAEQGQKVNIWSSLSAAVYIKTSKAVCLKPLSLLPACKLWRADKDSAPLASPRWREKTVREG